MSDHPLTRDGVRVLRGEVPPVENTGTLLQVLSIHRYLVDPALTQLLHDAGHDRNLERDVFDVVLSDGAHKIKCLLAPALNSVIWRGQVAIFDILWVTEFMLLTVPADTRDAPARTVCLVLDFEPIAQESSVFLVASSLLTTPPPTRGREFAFVEQTTGDALTFGPNATSARETALLPLAGERLYYMPLDSDSSALQWLQNTHVTTTMPKVCTSVFAPDADVLFSIDDVATMLDAVPSHSRSKATAATLPVRLPPITGVVRAASSVVHVGEPAIPNPLPFVFHIVLEDCTGSVEVAFFGSVCATYAAAIHDGDVIQLRGYAAMRDSDSTPLLFFPHGSTGEVLHVPERFWKLLQVTQLLDAPVATTLPTPSGDVPALPPIWLDCDFATTLDTQYGDSNNSSECFDFVGVLSFAGRICRHRKRKRDGDCDSASGPVQTYRWVKAVDRSSSTELAILLYSGSHLESFDKLQAGDVVLLTKLRWLDAGAGASQAAAPGVHDHVPRHDSNAPCATSTTFTVLRVNDSVRAFNALDDVSANAFFAKTLVANATVHTEDLTGESWLTSTTALERFRVRNIDADALATVALESHVHQFRELSGLCERLESLEHQCVAVLGRLLSIPTEPASDATPTTSSSSSVLPAYEIAFGDSRGTTQSRKATLRVHPVTGAITPLARLTDVVAPALQSFMQTLAPAIVDELVDEADVRRQHDTSNSADDATTAPALVLSRAFLEERLVKSRRVFLFSTHLYRTRTGKVDVHVDAILPYALEV